MTIFLATCASAAGFARQTVRDLWDYLKNPQLLETQYHWDRRAWGALAVLVMIDAVLTIPITWLLLGYENFITSVLSRDAPAYVGMEDYSIAETFFIAVVAAPLIEEPMFRGWLTGKSRHVWFGGLWIGFFVLASALLIFDENETTDTFLAMALLAAIIGSVVAHFAYKRGQPPSPLLVRLFPWLFWTSVISFALVHVTNYEYDNYLLVAPYVLPQLLAGVLWGYARVAYGLRASIMLHAISNFWITCLFVASDSGWI